jgi:hypothetical protein
LLIARERLLGFGPAGLEVRIRSAGADLVALRGSVACGVGQPAGRRRVVDRGAAAVWVRWPGGAGRALVDDGGRFDLAGVPVGPVCLAVTGKSANIALTPWFVC